MPKILKMVDIHVRKLRRRDLKQDASYYKQLDKLLDVLFEKATERELSWRGLAEASGLAYQTILNLGERITKRPQYRTVLLIANALGYALTVKTVAGRRKAQLRIAG